MPPKKSYKKRTETKSNQAYKDLTINLQEIQRIEKHVKLYQRHTQPKPEWGELYKGKWTSLTKTAKKKKEEGTIG